MKLYAIIPIAFVFLAGCGAKVSVDETGQPVHACTTTCRAALEQGGEPCADATNAVTYYEALLECACTGDAKCATECGMGLCAGEPVSVKMLDGGVWEDECGHCVTVKCTQDETNCFNLGH